LFTDADCIPESKNWLSGMQNHFKTGTDIVLGYGGYRKEKSFLNKLIRYDDGMVAFQYFSYALARVGYMGVGRNLAYRKIFILRIEWRIILSLYILKILIELPIFYTSSKKLRTTDLVFIFPLLEFFNALLQPLFFFSNLVTKQKPWK